MHAAREFCFEASVDRTVPLQQRLAAKVLADQHDAEVRFGTGTTPVPGALIQDFHMRRFKF